MSFQKTKINTICIFRLNKVPSSMINNMKIRITTLNEGSHTRLIQYKMNSSIRISILQRGIKRIRYVWLGTHLYKNITFARSLWKIARNYNEENAQAKNQPIGISFIRNKLDIHKYIYELYYCYGKEFEKNVKFRSFFWGRKYIIYQMSNKKLIIQEFFSTSIIL
uniref:Uncharacterized protein n=1 Tax=Polysiphonia sertularioides TaxID=945028 RepID=A0A1Z1MG05_9FLOR|nr:hypothetical protein [Polysiphonia sertularioides]